MLTTLFRALMFWKHRRDPQVQKLYRYSAVSLVSVVVSVVVLAFTYGVLHAAGEIECTLFSNVVATFPSYFLNRTWVWGKGGRSHLTREVLPFWALSIFGIAFSIVGASAAHAIVRDHRLIGVAATAVVEIANLSSFGIFWILKFLVFDTLFHHRDDDASVVGEVDVA